MPTLSEWEIKYIDRVGKGYEDERSYESRRCIGEGGNGRCVAIRFGAMWSVSRLQAVAVKLWPRSSWASGLWYGKRPGDGGDGVRADEFDEAADEKGVRDYIFFGNM